jgi:hypothetical protein
MYSAPLAILPPHFLFDREWQSKYFPSQSLSKNFPLNGLISDLIRGWGDGETIYLSLSIQHKPILPFPLSPIPIRQKRQI